MKLPTKKKYLWKQITENNSEQRQKQIWNPVTKHHYRHFDSTEPSIADKRNCFCACWSFGCKAPILAASPVVISIPFSAWLRGSNLSRLLGFSLRKWNRREKQRVAKIFPPIVFEKQHSYIPRNIYARHVTSRCQGLFPLLSFSKGKGLETRLSQLLCQIFPCPNDCAANVRYFDSFFTVSKCLARCAYCHNRHWKLHYSSTYNFIVTHSSPVLLRQIAQGTPSVWSMFPWQHLPA